MDTKMAINNQMKDLHDSLKKHAQELKDKPKLFFSGRELLEREIEEIPTLVFPILPKVGLVAVAGSSDTGKSSFCRQLATAICSDGAFLGWPLKTTFKRAIYVSTEDDNDAISFLLRKQWKGKNYPLSAYDGLRFIFEIGKNLVEILDSELVHNPVDLIVIDTFTDLYGGKMNESNRVRFFLNQYSQLAQKYKCLIIFIHHTRKGTDDSEPSKHNLLGSQGFEAKMRMVIELRKDYYDPSIRHLCIVKGNYLPDEFKGQSYVLEWDGNMIFRETSERILFEELVKPSNKIDNSELKQKAIELRKAGKSLRETGHELGKSKSTIERWTKDCPVP